ncbi:MAG: hypothetical protein NZ602_15000 [Thermoguttaceae bacterium]|nr:hypothetical protein [Thermoguttaceae bacterium]MDW8037107.1 hypothetical protein [Thermoguttaceae bacterium]
MAEPQDRQEGWVVHIEFKRIQTYLFSVPRLPVMVGANAILGQMLRGLCRKDNTGKLTFDPNLPSLPWLAHQCGSQWPTNAPPPQNWPIANQKDPLYDGNTWQDNPAQVGPDTGVLIRDGGHFKAVFPAYQKAKDFLQQAEELIQTQLPGVLIDTRISRIFYQNGQWQEEDPEAQTQQTQPWQESEPRGEDVFFVPQAEVCEYSGNEPASVELEVTPTEKPVVALSVKEKYEAGRQFDRGETRDILGILRPHLLGVLGFESSQQPFPTEFADLSIGGYLAVVHVDGNSVGSRFSEFSASLKEKDFFQRWAKEEQFFHTSRVGMRQAACQAFERVFRSVRRRAKGGQQVPLRVLMLGGDDLLMVCGAPFALPFLVELAKGLRETTKNMPDHKGPLTIGAGVVMAHDKIPFHRAHELAEQLAQSAKRLKSALPPEQGNVVDWILVTESWHGDLAETRRRDFLVDNLILSAKPYPILSANEDSFKSLEQMLHDAKELAQQTQQGRFARSQLHQLASALTRGFYTAEFAAKVMESTSFHMLKEKGYVTEDWGPWTKLSSGNSYCTQILDLLELYELEMLVWEAEAAGELQRETSEPVGAVE